MASTVTGPIVKSLYVSLNAFKFVQVMTLSVLAWEVISTIPMELRLYRRGIKPTYLLLSFSRYFAVLSLSLDVAFNIATDVTPEFCERNRYTLALLASIVQFVTVPLLLLRTYAIWGKNKALLPLLFIFWVLPMAIGIYACTTYFGVPNFTFIPIDIVGGCSAEPHDGLIAASPYIANLIVDSLILFLTLGRLIQLKKGMQTSFVTRLLIRDGILYYIVVVVINIINLIFFLAPGIPANVPRAIFAAPATVAATIMVGRLFFNLQNSFLSLNGEVLNTSEGSRGSSSRNRGNLSIDHNRPLYPMQPIQVSYAVDTSKRVDEVDRVAARHFERDASTDSKIRPVVDYV
jgi:hypothetical protein